MIAAGLTFIFGFFAATLIALLLVPVIVRRAKRIARREFEATIPASANEIRAGYDHVRAEAALNSRRREIEAREMREKAATERAEAGRMALENAQLKARNRDVEERLARHDEEVKGFSSDIEARDKRVATLDESMRDARHDLTIRAEEMDALAVRYRELTATQEERQRENAALKAQVKTLTADLKAAGKRPAAAATGSSGKAERSASANEGAGAAPQSSSDDALAREAPAIRQAVAGLLEGDPDDGELRDRIGDLAAKVIALAADRPGSSLPAMLEPASAGAETLPDGRPSLAGRVERLRNAAPAKRKNRRRAPQKRRVPAE